MHIFRKARTERTVVVIRDRRFKSLAEGDEHKLSLVFRKGDQARRWLGRGGHLRR